jgi:hypothetical protein
MKRMGSIHPWLFFLATLLIAGLAVGAVKREGTWPDADPAITIDLTDATRAEAVRKVADAAGWNVVFKGLPSDHIDVHVKHQPATRVLDLVLSDGAYVARRDADIIQIQRDDAVVRDNPSGASSPSSSTPAPSSSSPPSSTKGKHHTSDKERTVFGGNARVEKTETVGDISVFGGSVDLLGKATGDIAVFGGSVHIYSGAQVDGELFVLGGQIVIDDDAVVDGDVVALGGEVRRSDKAKIGGEVKLLGKDTFDSDHDHESDGDWNATKSVRTIGSQVTKTAFLFLLGAVVIAIATRRMQLLQSEIALRPMRSVAIGLASLLVGAVLVALLCVTIVGIPVAIVALLIAILAAYAGFCAVLSAMGSALVAHRSENPYVHLAVGCGVFLITGFIPYFGSLVTALILFAGLGAFAATRAAGFIPVNR